MTDHATIQKKRCWTFCRWQKLIYTTMRIFRAIVSSRKDTFKLLPFQIEMGKIFFLMMPACELTPHIFAFIAVKVVAARSYAYFVKYEAIIVRFATTCGKIRNIVILQRINSTKPKISIKFCYILSCKFMEALWFFLSASWRIEGTEVVVEKSAAANPSLFKLIRGSGI